MIDTEVAPRIAPLLLLLSRVAETLAGKTQLRPGLSVQEAAEIMWAYSSPELYGLLVISRG